MEWTLEATLIVIFFWFIGFITGYILGDKKGD
jgi:hypothetical protein